MQNINYMGKPHHLNETLSGFKIKESPESKNVESIAINQKTKELFVKFKGSKLSQYLYSNVDEEVLQDIMKAESVGSFIHARVMKKFDFKKIDDLIFIPIEE